jgi:hypothetical protein
LNTLQYGGERRQWKGLLLSGIGRKGSSLS